MQRRSTFLVGIDVGGTFTDAVVVHLAPGLPGDVVATAKVPTEMDDLAGSILGALDAVLQDMPPGAINRLSLSTTLITNLIAQGRLPDVALVLIPGPGLDPMKLRLPGLRWVVPGAIDFRGREQQRLDEAAVRDAVAGASAAGVHHLAIVGKFSPRNPAHELAALAVAERMAGASMDFNGVWRMRCGHTVAGQLGFPRRAAATALTVAIEAPFRDFYQQVHAAVKARGLACPIVVLKADGGTLPLAGAMQSPLDSLCSGPAAGAMGALALMTAGAESGATAIMVDVGGTTTDLALILDGEPLMASRGAELDGYLLPVRALAVRSLPVGGDSTLATSADDAPARLLPTRAGPAACLGGPAPALTDALRYLGYTGVGDRDLAHRALATLGDPEAVARSVIVQALDRIEAGIAEVFALWEREPVYRLWELRRRRERAAGGTRPDRVLALGAGAPPLVSALEARLGREIVVPPYAAVANALGAALACTTFTTTLHVDTEQQRLEVAETGEVEWLRARNVTLDEVRAWARARMVVRAAALGLPAEGELDVVEALAEQFNHVEGWQTVGKLFDVQLTLPPGLTPDWHGTRRSAAGGGE